MDNCEGDNKNRHAFAFFSLLIAKRVFDIIEVGFLPVGDTHEDIYGTYGRLSTKLMKKHIFSLQEMMDCYRTCKDQKTFVPYLIYEIFDFKIFVDPHLLVGNNIIIAIKKC